MDHAAYCDALAVEIARFVELAEGLEPVARVPSCPDWTAADLLEHLGSVHRWAGAQVKVLTPKRLPRAEMDFGVPADPSGFPDWLAKGGRFVVDTLRAADSEAPMWAWGADKHARFWARRMLHETAIHRADAQLTAGVEPTVGADVAVDGVDEFLENVPNAAYFAPRVDELRGAGERIALKAADAGVAWTITLEPERFVWSHEENDATVTVEGDASDLYLATWGRYEFGDESRFKVAGDRALLAFWRERSAL